MNWLVDALRLIKEPAPPPEDPPGHYPGLPEDMTDLSDLLRQADDAAPDYEPPKRK